MRANMIIEKSATDRRLVRYMFDKNCRLVYQIRPGRLFLWFMIIFACGRTVGSGRVATIIE